MPITETGIGYSKITPDKQDGYYKYLNLHIKITKNVFNRFKDYWGYEKRYYYIDCTAGCGIDQSNMNGSPIIFCESIKKYNIDYYGYLVDEVSANCESLQKNIYDKNIEIFNNDFKIIVPEIINNLNKNKYGLLYIDPNGIPDFELLKFVADKQTKLDILIRCPTTAIKRDRCRKDSKRETLSKSLKSIGKKKILIREPLENDKWKWTFLFLTNNEKIQEWQSERFYDIDKPIGKQIFFECDKTKKEISELNQNDLFRSIYE